MAEWKIHNVFGDTLEHHGILGMHWGIRRYQNKDGTLTDAGKKRLKTLEGMATKKVDKAYEIGAKLAEKEKKRLKDFNVKTLDAENAANKLGIKDEEVIKLIKNRDKLMPLSLKYESGKTYDEKVLNFYNDERNMYKIENNMRKGAIDRYQGSKGLMGMAIKMNENYMPTSEKIANDGWKIRTEQMEHIRKNLSKDGYIVLSKPSFRTNGNVSWNGEELYIRKDVR